MSLRLAASILGVVACITGGVWIVQGVGWLKGSFMTGRAFWAWTGLLTLGVGLGLLALGRGTARRP